MIDNGATAFTLVASMGEGGGYVPMIAYSVNENQRGHVYLNPDTAFTVTSGGGKPGQSYPCVVIAKEIQEDIPRNDDRGCCDERNDGGGQPTP